VEEKKKHNFDFINLIILLWFIGSIVVCIYFWIVENKKPTLDEYREENYYITNGTDYVIENYDYEQENFTSQDLIDAYNAGLNDGIEQTEDYYRSLDEDDFF